MWYVEMQIFFFSSERHISIAKLLTDLHLWVAPAARDLLITVTIMVVFTEYFKTVCSYEN